MSKTNKEQQWEPWVKDLYTKKFYSFLKAEAHISDLTDDFFRDKSDAPFVKTRPKSLSSFTEKVQKKLDEKSGNILKFVSDEKQVKNLFFDKRGIGDLVGMRLIFLRYPDVEYLRTDFITNFLVGKHGFIGSALNDIKNETNGYKAFHFKLQFSEEHDNINLEIQCMGIMQHLWIEAEHNLLYKQSKTLSADQISYMKGLYQHLSSMLQEVESMLFLPWE